MGRAAVCGVHGHRHRAGLCLRPAGGEVPADAPQGRSSACGPPPSSVSVCWAIASTPTFSSAASTVSPGLSLPAAPCGAAHRHQLLHLPDSQLRRRCLPGRRCRAQRKLLSTLATYVAMFPQLIAGPIVRYADIAPQLNSRHHTLDGRCRPAHAASSSGLPKRCCWPMSCTS